MAARSQDDGAVEEISVHDRQGRPVVAHPGNPNTAAIGTKVEHMQSRDDDALLTPSEVAAMFRVNPKTVTRWARIGRAHV